MISDITLGQYFPAKSVLHRADPRMKICLTIFVIVLIFTSQNFFSLGLVVAGVAAAMVLSKIPIRLYLKSLKAILILVIFTSVLNIFYGTGEPLWQWGIFRVTLNGILNSIFVSVRIVILILTTSILTFTTSPTQLTDAIERLLRPLAKLHVPVHEFAMMMTIALRFVPTLLEETDKIMSAQKARGADMESGGLMQRIFLFKEALVPVLIPLVRLGLPPGLRPGHRHGEPLLPRGRGPHQNEDLEAGPDRLAHIWGRCCCFSRGIWP